MATNIQISQALILTASLVAGTCLFAGSPMNEPFVDKRETSTPKKRQSEDFKEQEVDNSHKKTRLSKEEEDSPSTDPTSSITFAQQEKCRYSPTDLYRILKTNPQQVADSEELQELVADAYFNELVYNKQQNWNLLFPKLDETFKKDPKFLSIAIDVKPELITQEFIAEVKEQADQGDYNALRSYALLCAHLFMPEGPKYIRLAAEQGDTSAQCKLGLMYCTGDQFELSDEQAVKWWLTAAEKGHPLSQYNLALVFINGEGRPISFKEAEKWLLRAAEQGHAESQYKLAKLYTSKEYVEQSLEKALEWLHRASEQDLPAAMFELGEMYYSGDVVPQSFEEAAKWYMLAAQEHYSYAKIKIAEMYYEGDGLPQSYEEALRWFIKSTFGTVIEAKILTKVRAKLSYLLKLTGPNNLADLKKFEFTTENHARADTYIAVLEKLKTKFNPESKFNDSYPNRYLQKSFEKLIHDLVQYQSILPFFSRPGFLVTNVCPNYNVCQSPAKIPYLRPLNLEGETFYCMGEEAIKAGENLQKLLWRVEEPTYLEAIDYLEGMSDLEDIETQEAIEQLRELKKGFTILMNAMRNATKDYVEQRNQKFYKVFFEGRLLGSVLK